MRVVSIRLLCLAAMVSTTLVACGEPVPLDPPNTDPGSHILVEPCGWQLSEMSFGQQATQQVTISNTGEYPLVIEAVTAQQPFAVNGTTALTLDVGSTYQLEIAFEGSAYGSLESELVVVSDAENEPTLSCALQVFVISDGDGDGYDAAAAGGEDCDDSDDTVHPGAQDTWYDGIDSDCDGADDFDKDGDGFQAELYNPDAAAGGGDCDDENAAVSPGATEVYYDGVDSDCAGDDDFDQDGDGFASDAFGGDDCDDEDAGINPDAFESLDGRDQDCNGIADDDVVGERADVLIQGDDTDDQAGRNVIVTDLDGNGQADLVVGAHRAEYKMAPLPYGQGKGAIGVFLNGSWGTGASLSDADLVLRGGEQDEFGYSLVNAGDVNGDGHNDVAVGAPMWGARQGRVYLFSGADVGSLSAVSAPLNIAGSKEMRLGLALGTDQDLNGDGLGDVVVYGVGRLLTENYLGLLYGADDLAGQKQWSDLDASWVLDCDTYVASGEWSDGVGWYETCGEDSIWGIDIGGGNAAWPNTAHRAADFDGDGYQDLLLADSLDDTEHNNAGRIWILWGQDEQYDAQEGVLDDYASVVLTGDAKEQRLGHGAGVIEDLDGDGADEFLLVPQKGNEAFVYLGGAHLRDARLDRKTDAQATLDLSAYSSELTQIANAGDWSGDGQSDLALGFSDSGRVFLLARELWSGSFDPADVALATFKNGPKFSRLGTGIAPVNQDLNGDGKADLALGDSAYDASRGGAALFFGGK